jgi:hypothetical protein
MREGRRTSEVVLMPEVAVNKISVEVVLVGNREDARITLNDFPTEYVPGVPPEVMQKLVEVYLEVKKHVGKEN